MPIRFRMDPYLEPLKPENQDLVVPNADLVPSDSELASRKLMEEATVKLDQKRE